MRPRSQTVVALDIGGSSVKSGRVVDGAPSGDVVVTQLIESGTAGELTEAFAAAIRAVAATAEPLRVAAAVPDPFDHARGVSLMTHKFAALEGLDVGPLGVFSGRAGLLLAHDLYGRSLLNARQQAC